MGANVQAPWLGRPGLGVVIGCYLLVAVTGATYADGQFMASPLQLSVALVAAAATVAGALAVTPGTPNPNGRWGVAVAVSMAVPTAYQLAERYLPETLPAALACLVYLGILGIGVAAVRRYRLAPAGLGAGAVLTYCWVGLVKATELASIVAMVEQVALVLLAVAVLVVAAR